MTTITYPNTSFTFTNGITGSTGTTITSSSITTNTVNTKLLTLSNGTGASGTILSTNGTNLVWITPPTSSTIITSNINMNTNNITNVSTVGCTGLNATTILGPTTIVNPVTFANPPTSITPLNSNELATKSYVDNVFPSIYNLYLNTSVTVLLSGTTYYTLSNTPTIATNQKILTTSTTNGFPGTLISEFISDQIGVTQLPISLWCLNIWGTIDVTTDPTNYYATFSLYNNGSITLIGTSTNSANHIALTSTTIPYKYTVNYTLSSTITTNTTDRILIQLFAYKVSGTISRTVTTYFETPYYSYSQIQISNPISVLPYIWSGSVNSNLNMNNFNITSTGDMSISCPNNKNLTFNTPGIITNIGTDTTVPSVINLLSSGSTGSIYIKQYAVIDYTVTPTSGHIGEVINVSLLATPSFVSSGTEINVASQIIQPGVWIVTANSGFLNTAVGTNITRMTIYIKNGTNFICQHEINGAPNVSGGLHILMCSGIIGITTQSTITLFQAMTFSGGSFRVADANSTNFMFKFVRVA